MTRALWVTAEPPDRHLGGGSIRQAYLLEALAGRTETHLLLAGTLEDERTRSTLAGITEVHRPPVAPPRWRTQRRARDVWRATFKRQSAEVVDQWRARRLLARHLGMAPSFGVVCIEHHGLAPLLPARRHNRWALTMHNVPSQVAVHAAAVAPARRQRWLREQERKRAERLEHWALDAFDVVFAVSDEDAAALPGPAIVVPNGVDTERFRPSALPREPRLVFVGTLGYLPNVDGITWFCEEVMPRVQSVVPGAVLDVVGRLPTPEVLALGRRPGIRVHVDVPDVLPFLHAARLAVVPLRIGSGTRLKALEAMAAGRPVVGTSTGLEGLGVVSGQHALVTDGVDEMASDVLAVLARDELAGRLALEGRRLVESRYRWDRIGERFVAALLGLPS